MKHTTTTEKHMDEPEITSNSPSDNPELVFQQFSIPTTPADQFPEVEILTTESPAFRIHIKSN